MKGANSMKTINICHGEYASKWSLTDFYEESEQRLRDAIESGEDFDTGWWGCKKEIRYARVCREDGHISIEVSCHMDDLFDGDDLIYDALWEETRTEEELPDDIIDSIRDAAIDDGIDDHTDIADALPAYASFDQVVGMIDRFEGYAEAENNSMYQRLCGIVAAHVEYMKGAKT